MMAPDQADELATIEQALAQGGLQAALAYLNSRTPYRFSSVYRFDGDMLRSVCLFDRWSRVDTRGVDSLVSETFCAIVLQAEDGALEIDDGRSDTRFPWMAQSSVVSYCGVLIRDDEGQPYGTLCHFDVQRCEPSRHELSLLKAAVPLMYRFLAHQHAGKS